MSTTMRIVLAAAAVAAVAFIGYQLLPNRGGVGTAPSTTASASARSTSSTSPTPSATPAPRSHLFVNASAEGPSVTLLAPARWHGDPGSGILISDRTEDPPDGAGMIGPFYGELYVYGDPCHWSTSTPASPVSTVDEFVAAITAQAGREASDPIDVTIGGYSGKSLILHVPDDADFSTCDEGAFASWKAASDPEPGPSRYSQGPGQIDELWILDVDGTLAVIDGGYYAATPAEYVDELRAIVQSMTFE